MLIALDFDGTYTADPAMWDDFIEIAKKRGHEVVCATMRYPSEPVQMGCEVIYTSREAKGPFLESLGRKPAIWIDDMPYWIVANSG